MISARQGRFSNLFAHQSSLKTQKTYSRQHTLERHKLTTSLTSGVNNNETHNRSLIIRDLPKLQNKTASVKVSKEKILRIQYALKLQSQKFKMDKRMGKNWEKQKKNQNSQKKKAEPKNQANKENLNPTAKNYKNLDTKIIVEALQTLRERQMFNQLKDRIDTLQSQCQRYLQKKQKDKADLKKRANYDKMQLNKIPQYSEVPKKEDLPEIMELQNILRIQEPSFFKVKRDQQDFNIFLYLKDPGHPMFFTGREQLRIYNFSVDSIYQTSNKKFNEGLYKSMSTYARMAVINDSKDIPSSFRAYQQDLNQQYNNVISSDNILQLVNGQVLPQVLNRAIQNEFVRKQSSQDIQVAAQTDDPQIEKMNKGVIWENPGEDIEQFYYNRLRATNIEQRQKEKLEAHKMMLENLMTEFVKCKLYSIEDPKVEAKLDNRKTELMIKSFDEIGNHPSISKERRINQYKRKKDKVENMKLKLIREQIKRVKEYDKFLKPKPESKSTSRSKNQSKKK